MRIDADGAPNDQGMAQGQELRGAIEAELLRLRRNHSFASWHSALRRAARGPGRRLGRFLPQLHERLEGIALALHTDARALQLAESVLRVGGIGYAGEGRLQVVLDVPPALERGLFLRTSRPDAGGFYSVELTAAPFAGCLAGVNSEGITVVCLEDRDATRVSLRYMAQELLFRAQDLEAGIDHVRRRGAYLGSVGTLIAGDADGRIVALRFSDGRLEKREAELAPAIRRPTVELDAVKRKIVWFTGSDDALEAIAPPSPPPEDA